MHEFAIRYDRWCGWFLAVCGLGRRWSRVIVDSDRVAITMVYIRVRDLAVSLEDPAGFTAALGFELAATPE